MNIAKNILKMSAISLVIGLSACSSSKSALPEFMVNPPKEEGIIYGSGEAQKASFQLAKETADTRACKEVAKVLNQRVKSVLSDFMSQSGAELESAEVLEFVESTSKNVTDVSLTGCQIHKREYNEESSTVHSLARYDLKDAKSMIKDMAHKNLASKEALYNRLRADQAFDKLDAEIDKLK